MSLSGDISVPQQRPGGRESLHRHRDKQPFSRLARADINFLAGIIKRRCPAAPYLSDMRREPPGASTERRRWKALPMASVI